jgi:hypothetical protein
VCFLGGGIWGFQRLTGAGSSLPLDELEVEMTEMSSSWRMSTSVFWARARAQAENCATLCIPGQLS